jgi:hypothetical protein
VEDDCRVRRSQKLPHNERGVSTSILMMQCSGVVAPTVWTFAPDVFPQSSQNFATDFSVHRLSWWDKFLLHDALITKKKKNQHSFDTAPKLCFLRLR